MLEKFNKLIEFKIKHNRLDVIFKSENYTYSMNIEEVNELVGDLYELLESMEDNSLRVFDSANTLQFDRTECLGDNQILERKDFNYAEIYQKALINQICIDIKNDDGVIVKNK